MSKNKLEWREFVTPVALTTVAMVQTGFIGDACNMKTIISVSARFNAELQTMRVISDYCSCPPEETAGLPDPHHMIREPGSESTASSLAHCLSACLHSCTEQLSTRLSTWPLVFVSVKKILHLYLQQLNRGQLSTCVVCGWRISEFNASRGGKAFYV